MQRVVLGLGLTMLFAGCLGTSEPLLPDTGMALPGAGLPLTG
jgi:hypothetical protein